MEIEFLILFYLVAVIEVSVYWLLESVFLSVVLLPQQYGESEKQDENLFSSLSQKTFEWISFVLTSFCIDRHCSRTKGQAREECRGNIAAAKYSLFSSLYCLLGLEKQYANSTSSFVSTLFTATAKKR